MIARHGTDAVAFYVSGQHGGDGADRGGEICACFGVSTSAVILSIADGARSLDAIAGATRAGSNCGSCRPELRALVRSARTKEAA